MNKERRGPPETNEEIAIACNKAIDEVKRKFPGGPVPGTKKDEWFEVRINGNMIWPPDRATVTEYDVRHAHFEYLDAYHRWVVGRGLTLRQAQDAYVNVQAKGEALLWIFRYYVQDQNALVFAAAKEKFEKSTKAEIAA